MRIKKKETAIIGDIEKFFDIIDQSLLVFGEGVKNYLHLNGKAVDENLQSIVKLETDSSLLQREIEASLYRNEMRSNADVLRLVERMGHVINMMNNYLFQFEIERPNIPEELNVDFLKLLELSSQAVANTIPASKAFFHTPEIIPEKVRRVYFYQKEADRQAKSLKRKVFHEMSSLKLSEKVHLRYFALHIEELALQAMKVADQLSVMSIRHQPLSVDVKSKFLGSVITGVLTLCVIANAAVLIFKNPSGVFGGGSNLIIILVLLSVLLALMLVFQIMKSSRERKQSETRLKAQEDEISDNSRKMSEMEVQLMKMENDHLQNLLDLKRKETTGVVEKISEQKEFIDSIYNSITQAESADDATRGQLLHDVKFQLGLRRNAAGEQEDFYAQVEQLHKDFSVRLASKFPQLTPQEKKLATLIRLEFSTKYIANLLNLSSKSVEIERHRMRSKMGLTRDIKLTEFLKNI